MHTQIPVTCASTLIFIVRLENIVLLHGNFIRVPSLRGRCLGSTMSTVTSEQADIGVTSAVCGRSGNVDSDITTSLYIFVAKATQA